MVTIPIKIAKICLSFLIGFSFTISLMTVIKQPNIIPDIQQKTILFDTLSLENQGSVDIYKTETGNYLVISLDDLKYVTKKNRRARKLISDLEALFERLELPVKEPIKPEVK